MTPQINKLTLALIINMLLLDIFVGYWFYVNINGGNSVQAPQALIGNSDTAPKQIFSREGTIQSIKGDTFIIESENSNTLGKETLTVTKDSNTTFATYSPDAEKAGLPTDLASLAPGMDVEVTANEDIAGKTAFVAKIIKYTIKNQ